MGVSEGVIRSDGGALTRQVDYPAIRRSERVLLEPKTRTNLLRQSPSSCGLPKRITLLSGTRVARSAAAALLRTFATGEGACVKLLCQNRLLDRPKQNVGF